jgi:hypothetical protein
MEHRSICRGSIRRTWRGFFIWGLRKICEEGSGGGTAFSTQELHKGNLEGGGAVSFLGTSEDT